MPDRDPFEALDPERIAATIDPARIAETIEGAARAGRLRLDPDTVEQDLARLVLGLIEFLRQLMELQAVRRMEAGSLTPEQEEELGLTLMRAAGAVRDLAQRFGLTEADLHLDLGPLGRLT